MVDISAVINNQYPHFLYKRTSGEAVQDANGSWITEDEAAFTLCGACREETNGRGNKVQAANGVFREFSSLVQIPVGVQRIPEGTEIVVTSEDIPADQLLCEEFVERAKADGVVRISGECLKFDEGRLHSRLWV